MLLKKEKGDLLCHYLVDIFFLMMLFFIHHKGSGVRDFIMEPAGAILSRQSRRRPIQRASQINQIQDAEQEGKKVRMFSNSGRKATGVVKGVARGTSSLVGNTLYGVFSSVSLFFSVMFYFN